MFNRNLFAHIEKTQKIEIRKDTKILASSTRLQSRVSHSKINGRLSTSVPVASTIRQQDKYILFRKVLSYTRSSFLIAFLTSALFFGFNLTADASDPRDNPRDELGAGLGAGITRERLFELVNQTRLSENLSPLRLDGRLTQAAQNKALDMLTKTYFAHISPAGIDPWSWIKSAGYTYEFAGENLAMDFITAEGMHQGLMKSDSHRANILNPRYEDIGVGVVRGTFENRESIIAVQLFGHEIPQNSSMDSTSSLQVNSLQVSSVPTIEEIQSNSLKLAISSESLDNLSDNVNNDLNLVLASQPTSSNRGEAASTRSNRGEAAQNVFIAMASSYDLHRALVQDKTIDLALYFSLLVNLTILIFYLFRIVIETITQEISSRILYLLTSHKFLLRLTNGTRFVMRLFL